MEAIRNIQLKERRKHREGGTEENYRTQRNIEEEEERRERRRRDEDMEYVQVFIY